MPAHQIGNVSFVTAEEYRPRMLLLVEEPRAGTSAKHRKTLTVVREELPAGLTLEAYRQAQLQQLAPSGFQGLKASTLTIMGRDCPAIEAHSVGPGGLPLANLLAYVQVGTVVYTLSAACLRGADFDQARPELEKTFESFTAR